MRKKIAAVTGGILLFAAMAIPAYAGTWQSDANGWWWSRDDGSYPVSTWEWADGNQDGIAECYYFDSNGYMLTNTTTPDGYSVNADGAWVQDGVVQTKNVAAPAVTAPAAQVTEAIPNIGGTYVGTYTGIESGGRAVSLRAVFEKEGDTYWAEVDYFLKDYIPAYVGNGVFEDNWCRFTFTGTSNLLFEDLTTGESISFVRE